MTITRKVAKKMIDSGWTAEDVREVFPSFKTENFDVLVAFAVGSKIQHSNVPKGFFLESVRLSDPRTNYTILPETITLTGPGGTFAFPKPDPVGRYIVLTDGTVIAGKPDGIHSEARCFATFADAEFWRDNFPKLLGM